MQLAELMRSLGWKILFEEENEIVIQSSPTTLVGHAGRLYASIMANVGQVTQICAMYDPVTNRAVIRAKVQSSKSS